MHLVAINELVAISTSLVNFQLAEQAEISGLDDCFQHAQQVGIFKLCHC
jgi:hypothetical protein